MLKFLWLLGLRPRPRLGSLRRSPDPLIVWDLAPPHKLSGSALETDAHYFSTTAFAYLAICIIVYLRDVFMHIVMYRDVRITDDSDES